MTLQVKIKKSFGVSRDGKSARFGSAVGMPESHAAMSDLDVEFEAPVGFTILFGASGSGKTTTLKAISGIVRPDSGRISIGGDVLFDSDAGVNLPIRTRGIGFVFQDLALFPHLTSLENVEFGISGMETSDRRGRAQSLMDGLRISHIAKRKPRDISGGEAQRVALARALSRLPRLLLLDEPLSAIDEETKLSIISDLKRLNRELQLPILYVTHSREEAISLGERLIVYERGRIVGSGEPIEVFGTPVASSIARLTGVENIFVGQVISRSESSGTLTVEVDDGQGKCRIDVPFGIQTEGAQVTVAVSAGDILLATEEPRHTSLRNILTGRITSIEDQSNRTIIAVEAGVNWSASVTRQAVRELELAEGREVWLAFKTHSCYLLDQAE